MTEQDRAEFEAWASGRYGLIQRDFLRGVDGYYCKMTRLAYASWLAARRTQDAKVRELVEAVEAMEDQSTTVDEDGEDRCTQCGWYAYAHEPACVFALAAQLKEQDDED